MPKISRTGKNARDVHEKTRDLADFNARARIAQMVGNDPGVMQDIIDALDITDFGKFEIACTRVLTPAATGWTQKEVDLFITDLWNDSKASHQYARHQNKPCW